MGRQVARAPYKSKLGMVDLFVGATLVSEKCECLLVCQSSSSIHHTSVVHLWCITKTVNTTLTSLGGSISGNVTSCSSLHRRCRSILTKTIVGGNQPKRRKFSQRSGLVLSLSPLPEVEGLLLWDRSGLGMHSSLFVYSTSGSERWHIERESRWSVGALRVHWSPI